MNLDSLILTPQQDVLVLTQPGLTQHIAELYQYLSESSDARESFLDNPEPLLAEHLGIDLGQSTGTSNANRAFYRLLNCDPDPAPVAADPSSEPVGPYLSLLRKAMAGHTAEELTEAFARGFNVSSAADVEVDVNAEIDVRATVDSIVEAEINTVVKAATELAALVKVEVESSLAAKVDTKLAAAVEAKVASAVAAQIEAKLAAAAAAQIEAKLAAAAAAQIATKVTAQVIAKAAVELEAKTTIEAQLKALTSVEIAVNAEQELRADLELALEAEAAIEAGIDAVGPQPKRAAAAARLNRFDVQRLAGFVAARPALVGLILSQPSSHQIPSQL